MQGLDENRDFNQERGGDHEGEQGGLGGGDGRGEGTGHGREHRTSRAPKREGRAPSLGRIHRWNHYLEQRGLERGQAGAVFQFGEIPGEVKVRNMSYQAGSWKAEEVGEVLWVETRKRGRDTVEDVEVAIGDGVAWIWNLM